jgi:hypothetical protein
MLETVQASEKEKKSEKDWWDRFDIFSKFLGTVVLAAIPIVIGWGANHISQSLQKGQLVQSLIDDLIATDAKRDVALIALNDAIPIEKKCTVLYTWGCQYDPEKDPVVNIAMAIVKNSVRDATQQGKSPEEIEVAKKIIALRAGEEFYSKNFGNSYHQLASSSQRQVISNAQPKQLSPDEIASKANTSQIIAAIQPLPTQTTNNSLDGVRLVYIQYNNDQTKAANLQKVLQAQNISAPGIEQVKGIKDNDIRYSNPSDLQLAKNLQNFLRDKAGVQIEDNNLIDLSKNGYKVPPGQIEIWLKD